MRFLLIPVAHAFPALEVCGALSAIQAHFRLWSHDDTEPPTVEELHQLVELAYRFVLVSEALLQYAVTLGGKPSRN